jgi:hypothetical protein
MGMPVLPNARAPLKLSQQLLLVKLMVHVPPYGVTQKLLERSGQAL